MLCEEHGRWTQALRKAAVAAVMEQSALTQVTASLFLMALLLQEATWTAQVVVQKR